MREVTIHTMDYVDSATTGILSPYILPVEDLSKLFAASYNEESYWGV